jgi:(E)-4-hydroxy-3-methylbut-2-enyl-diphosphate synthase
VKSLGKLPEKIPALWGATVRGEERDANGLVGVVGVARVSGEAVGSDKLTPMERLATFVLIVASLNIFVGVFNLLPILPLDGGHMAVAIADEIRAFFARLRGRPRPAPIDVTVLTPITMVVFVVLATLTLLLLVADVINPVTLNLEARKCGSNSAEIALVVQNKAMVDLGIPSAPPPTLHPRRKTRQLKVGSVGVGSDSQVSVQSMCTTLTADVNATLQQIAELTASGCQIVRVAVPSQDDADALAQIAKKSQIPVIADIHFQPKYIFAAIDAGCAAVRVNPGNIKQFDDKVKEVAKAAGDAGIPIRIGVNAGSLDPRLLAKYGKATPEALAESALWEASLFEEHGFSDIKISVKHHDPVTMVNAYRILAAKCDYPLHLGVTEAGPIFQGTIKSATAFAILLAEGIGDTIRVSLSAPPVEEVKVGISILESLNLRQRKLEIVSCPSCGRAQVDVYTLAEKVQAGLEGMTVPLRVAVMGCVVNGPGEAREADLGVASGNGKGQIFVKGVVIKTVPEAQIVETLIEEAMRLAEEMEAAGVASGQPSVDVR